MGKLQSVCRIDDAELAKILNNLDRLSVQKRDKINGIVRSATNTIGRDARRLAPFDGSRKKGTHLRKAIKTKVKKANDRYATAHGTVFTDHATAPHAHLIEFGVKPHTIMPKRRKVLVIMANGIGRFVSGAVQHQGFGARPFMSVAFGKNKNKFISEVKAAIK